MSVRPNMTSSMSISLYPLFTPRPTYKPVWSVCRSSLTLSGYRGDLSHVTTLATKLRELNNKVADMQREQRYMREVEATFRDASELTNARAVWWSMGQIGVLIAAGIWQMRHLKVSPIKVWLTYARAEVDEGVLRR